MLRKEGYPNGYQTLCFNCNLEKELTLKRRRVMKGRNTYVLSARVPDALYERVKELAGKRKMTPNDWLKNIIVAAAKYKDEKPQNDQEPSVNVPTALTVVEEVVGDGEGLIDA